MKIDAFVPIAIVIGLGTGLGAPAQEQKIQPNQRGQAESMLSDVHAALKKNYYDPAFHGVDVDARYKVYEERIKKADTLGDAYRVVAAYLSGLDDSHTFFEPPRRSYIADYGYRMQIIGDACYITEVRPGSDAAQKLHPGDQVLLLNGYSVIRKDIWQLDYYLHHIAPKPATDFTVRSPSGEVRKVQVLTRYTQHKQIKDLTFDNGDSDFWNLVLDYERERRELNPRFVEQDDVMFWRLPAFNIEDSAVDRLIHLARRHKTLVLDLRGNPGGYVDTLARMVGSFFDHDVKIATRVRRKGEKQQIAKSRGKDAFTGDLIVLIDSGSASAAEVFARIIQLEHRGTVIGDRSSGSVMESQFYPFKSGIDIIALYGASITDADVIMADGKSLEKVGVTPDIPLLPTAAQLAAGHDPVLSRAAELGGLKLNPESAGKFFPFEWPPL